MWFETLTGFHEQSPEQVRKNISVDGATGGKLRYGAITPGGQMG